MPARYAFWKTPEGKPYKRLDDKYAPTSILKHLANNSTVEGSGNLQWPFDLSFVDNSAVLQSSILIQDNEKRTLNNFDTTSIVKKALHTIVREKGGQCEISATEFIGKANDIAAEFFRNPPQDFSIVTSISLGRVPSEPIRSLDGEVNWLENRTSFSVPNAVKNLSANAPIKFGQHIETTNYKWISIKTAGRSVADAIERATVSINFLRGVWTLLSGETRPIIPFGSPVQDSPGVIALGPLFTIHGTDGALASEYYWYDSHYQKDQQLYSPSSWETLETNRKWVFEKIQNHPCHADLVELIGRYAIAHDYLDHDVAFLQMWALIEKISDTIGAQYDTTIKRIAWPYFEDRKIQEEILFHLRGKRNQFVHSSKMESKPNDHPFFLIRPYVNAHLLSLLRNDFNVNSLAEYAGVLSLPTSLDALTRKSELINEASNFLIELQNDVKE